MKGLIQTLFCPLVLSVPLAAVLVASPAVSAQKATVLNFRVGPVRQLRKGVDAWPFIANPATPAELRVNASLARLNSRLALSLRNCDKGARAEMKEMGTVKKGQDPAEDDWLRHVEVTMTGPRFLSMVATEDTFCGGAYPDSETIAMVFDMTTGTPVDWVEMVAKSPGATAIGDTASDGSKMGALVLPALQKINLAAASAECTDAFEDPQSFLLWPDAKHGALVAEAFDLPHVVRACAEKIPLTLEQARKLGFNESLLSAIERAHRQASTTPKS